MGRSRASRRDEPHGCRSAGQSNGGVEAEAQLEPSERNFQAGRALVVADEFIGEPEAACIRGAARRNAQVRQAGPAEILDRGQRSWPHYLDPALARPFTDFVRWPGAFVLVWALKIRAKWRTLVWQPADCAEAHPLTWREQGWRITVRIPQDGGSPADQPPAARGRGRVDGRQAARDRDRARRHRLARAVQARHGKPRVETSEITEARREAQPANLVLSRLMPGNDVGHCQPGQRGHIGEVDSVVNGVYHDRVLSQPGRDRTGVAVPLQHLP